MSERGKGVKGAGERTSICAEGAKDRASEARAREQAMCGEGEREGANEGTSDVRLCCIFLSIQIAWLERICRNGLLGYFYEFFYFCFTFVQIVGCLLLFAHGNLDGDHE